MDQVETVKVVDYDLACSVTVHFNTEFYYTLACVLAEVHHHQHVGGDVQAVDSQFSADVYDAVFPQVCVYKLFHSLY